ncbi:MAG: hypothetical protein U0T81_13295 [Saprospiraceae bacterium]
MIKVDTRTREYIERVK